jgi:hypothetical protein
MLKQLKNFKKLKARKNKKIKNKWVTILAKGVVESPHGLRTTPKKKLGGLVFVVVEPPLGP